MHIKIITKGLFLMFCTLITFMAGPNCAFSHEEDDGFIQIDENTDTSNPNIKSFRYKYAINIDAHHDYDLAREAMKPLFKGTYADKNSKPPMNPMLGITEFNLNNDKIPEIIAFPIESSEFDNVLCGSNFLCPHYVLDLSNQKTKVIGVLPAFAVDRGDEIKNGYWTLKAFTKQDEPENFSYYELYVYDKVKKIYVKQDKPLVETK